MSIVGDEDVGKVAALEPVETVAAARVLLAIPGPDDPASEATGVTPDPVPERPDAPEQDFALQPEPRDILDDLELFGQPVEVGIDDARGPGVHRAA